MFGAISQVGLERCVSVSVVLKTKAPTELPVALAVKTLHHENKNDSTGLQGVAERCHHLADQTAHVPRGIFKHPASSESEFVLCSSGLPISSAQAVQSGVFHTPQCLWINVRHLDAAQMTVLKCGCSQTRSDRHSECWTLPAQLLTSALKLHEFITLRKAGDYLR